jgi:hypothetical protein
MENELPLHLSNGQMVINRALKNLEANDEEKPIRTRETRSRKQEVKNNGYLYCINAL